MLKFFYTLLFVSISSISKIFDNKYSIDILLDRTNYRYTIINGSVERPASPIATTPTVPGAPPTN